MEEIEVKFLDIDTDTIEQKLVALGAQKVFDRMYRRRVFDYPDLRLAKQSAWLRLRDEGDKVTLTYKQRIGVDSAVTGDTGMEEIEVTVSDFDKTALLLTKAGFIEKFYEENRRVRYLFDEIEFDIDYWPLLKPYLEIEAKKWEDIDRGIALLGLNRDEKKICSTFQVYEMNGIDENEFQILTFEKQIKKTS